MCKDVDKPAMSALDGMAALLAEGLARQSIYDEWDHLDLADKQSLLSVCEWLLMDWEALKKAHSEHVSTQMEPITCKEQSSD